MKTVCLRALTVADIHQSRWLYQELGKAVARHKPDLLAVVGDFLDLSHRIQDQFTTAQCAEFLAKLPVPHIIFTRGNHEGANWRDFIRAWRFERRPLIALYGTAFTLGPLVVLGFPCRMGVEKPWASSMPKEGNAFTRDPTGTKRQILPIVARCWLSPLIRRLRPAGRTLWLMQEPPIAQPICTAQISNIAWRKAVDRHQPLLTVSGHDHETPFINNTWWGKYDATVCVNAGQGLTELSHTVIDAKYDRSDPGLPKGLTVHAFPWDQSLEIQPFVPASVRPGGRPTTPLQSPSERYRRICPPRQ